MPNAGNANAGEAKIGETGRGIEIPDGTALGIVTDGEIGAANETGAKTGEEAEDEGTAAASAEITDGEGLVLLDTTDVDNHYYHLIRIAIKTSLLGCP